MSFQKIFKVRDALLKVSDNVGHYEAFKKNDQYIVWAEDSEPGSVNANNKKEIQTIGGTIDYFTKQEEDPNVDKIQKELDNDGISYRLESVQYEEDTEYIHYEWVWEVA